MKLKFIFKAILLTWIILWMVFLVRQSKKGQYEKLTYFYANDYNSRVKYLLGDDLADFLVFCAGNIPSGSTFDIRGFERYSIKEVRARYYLWPLYRTEDNPDFIIVYGSVGAVPDGYEKFKALEGKGIVYLRKGAL